jgi:alpha-L-fucosidase 2
MMFMKAVELYVAALFAIVISGETVAGDSGRYSLDYASPATVWTEALPIGNGRLGAMGFGGPGAERLQLNEDTLWDGRPDYMLQPKLKALIPEVRKMILAGKEKEAVRWFRSKTGNFVSRRNTSEAYQTLGSLVLRFPGHDLPSAYHRSLSLNDAIASCDYEVKGVKYKREMFTSFSDNVLVMRISADRRAAITFDAFFESPFSVMRKRLTMGETCFSQDGRGLASIQKVISGMRRICGLLLTAAESLPKMA